MNPIASIALLVGGVILMTVGISATNSFNSDASRFFTDSPTDKAVWMLIGGIVAAGVGLTMALRGRGSVRGVKATTSSRASVRIPLNESTFLENARVAVKPR